MGDKFLYQKTFSNISVIEMSSRFGPGMGLVTSTIIPGRYIPRPPWMPETTEYQTLYIVFFYASILMIKFNL